MGKTIELTQEELQDVYEAIKAKLDGEGRLLLELLWNHIEERAADIAAMDDTLERGFLERRDHCCSGCHS